MCNHAHSSKVRNVSVHVVERDVTQRALLVKATGVHAKRACRCGALPRRFGVSLVAFDATSDVLGKTIGSQPVFLPEEDVHALVQLRVVHELLGERVFYLGVVDVHLDYDKIVPRMF